MNNFKQHYQNQAMTEALKASAAHERGDIESANRHEAEAVRYEQAANKAED